MRRGSRVLTASSFTSEGRSVAAALSAVVLMNSRRVSGTGAPQKHAEYAEERPCKLRVVYLSEALQLKAAVNVGRQVVGAPVA